MQSWRRRGSMRFPRRFWLQFVLLNLDWELTRVHNSHAVCTVSNAHARPTLPPTHLHAGRHDAVRGAAHLRCFVAGSVSHGIRMGMFHVCWRCHNDLVVNRLLKPTPSVRPRRDQVPDDDDIITTGRINSGGVNRTNSLCFLLLGAGPL
jgi:hypothetical protein